jgi:hypothetical protein
MITLNATDGKRSLRHIWSHTLRWGKFAKRIRFGTGARFEM